MIDHQKSRINGKHNVEEKDSIYHYLSVLPSGNDESSEHFTLDTFTITPIESSPCVELDDVNYANFLQTNDEKDESAFEAVSMRYDIGITKKTRKWFQCLRKYGNDEVRAFDQPSNEKLLTIAFVSFMAFTILQSIAAYIAKSEAMMGDSAAMAVDAFTYGFNLIAERMKSRAGKISVTNDHESGFQENKESRGLSEVTFDATKAEELIPVQIETIDTRSARKFKLTLELIPPLISVFTLLVVTVFILRNAIVTILLDESRPISEQKIPNVILMLGFSTLNLLIDFINVFFFAKAHHALGYKTVDYEYIGENEPKLEEIINLSTSKLSNQQRTEMHTKDMPSIREIINRAQDRGTYAHISDEESSVGDDNIELVDSQYQSVKKDGHEKLKMNKLACTDDQFSEQTNSHKRQLIRKEEANLNMCSAYTHVFADTIRSIAVVVAATMAIFYDSVTPEEADATAAIVVSAVIVISLFPLLKGLKNVITELITIRTEEGAERMSTEILSKSKNITPPEITYRY